MAPAIMNVSVTFLFLAKFLHRMPGSDACVARSAHALEVWRPVHTVLSAEEGNAEFLVRQSAQSPTVLFFALDGAVGKIGYKVLVLDLPADTVGLFDSKRFRSGRHSGKSKKQVEQHGW